MPLSDARNNANRDNATHSTGPKTEEGKARSRLNGLRHGLTGQTVVLPTEDLKIYMAFTEKLFVSLEPESDLERQLAQSYANEQWRLNRCGSMENAYLALGHAGPASDTEVNHPELHSAITTARHVFDNVHKLELFSRYHQRIARQAQNTLKQLREEQARRKERQEKEMYNAILIRKFTQMEKTAFEPASFGFASSTAQIDQQILFRETLEKAKIAREVGYDPEKYRIKLGTA